MDSNYACLEVDKSHVRRIYNKKMTGMTRYILRSIFSFISFRPTDWIFPHII